MRCGAMNLSIITALASTPYFLLLFLLLLLNLLLWHSLLLLTSPQHPLVNLRHVDIFPLDGVSHTVSATNT